MKCSNCLTEVKSKHRTVCQQCLIDIESDKDYLEKENLTLKDKLRRRNMQIKGLKAELKGLARSVCATLTEAQIKKYGLCEKDLAV